MAITATTEWRDAMAADRRTSAMMDALAAIAQLSDVPELIELIRSAPTPAGTVAHGILQRAVGHGRLLLSRDHLDAWTAALLDRNAETLSRWRHTPSDATLSAVYDRLVSSLFEGASYSLLLEHSAHQRRPIRASQASEVRPVTTRPNGSMSILKPMIKVGLRRGGGRSAGAAVRPDAADEVRAGKATRPSSLIWVFD